MIEISAHPAPKTNGPARPTAIAVVGTDRFQRAFACELPVRPLNGDPAAAVLAGLRQAPAEDGKDLPVLAVEGETEGDEPEAGDAAFAWFQLPAIAPDQAVPAPVQAGSVSAGAVPVQAGAAPAAALPADGAAPALPMGEAVADAPGATLPAMDGSAPILLPADFVAVRETPLPPEQAALIAAGVAAVDGKAVPAKPAAPVALSATPAPREAGATIGKAGAPVAAPVEAAPRDFAAPVEAPRAAAQTLRPPVQLVAVPPRFEAVQPLVTALVAEIAPALQRQSVRDLAAPALSPLVAAELQQAPRQVMATADAQLGNLDMSRQEWMGAMIETIEALRETPNARETSIRLSPDALGTVDIAITQEGDRVHVRFTADTPAGRAMLNEAQPRLAELAEAKGVRLGQTTVDGGATGQGAQGGQRNDGAERRRMNSMPASAPGAAEAETETDQRIA